MSSMDSPASEGRSRLLFHVRADQSARWRRGERVRVEEYLARYPDLAGDDEALLDLIGLELLHRLENGETPCLEEYLHRFPRHADSVRRSWSRLRTGRTPDGLNGDAASTAAEPTEVGPLSRRPAPPSLPGFTLLDKLGEGGMGVVYKARDLRLGQLRAVKIIRAALTGSTASERFTREAKAAARLDHPGVVRVYNLGEHDGHLFICMEHVAGGSLHALLRRGALPVREAAELIRRLALAVQHAHDHKVLHRDLKPANVLLDASGAPKVADFGLAKLLDEDDGLTRTGDIMGTPSYMAPEQAEGRLHKVSERTDIYALGAILYECLTGRPPFKSASRSETMDLVRGQKPQPPRRLRAEVPPELEAICLKCLHKRPEDRYATAGDLADDLQDWLAGRPPRTRPSRRRRPRFVIALLLLLVAGVTAAVVPLVDRHPPHEAGPAALAGQWPVPRVWNQLLDREPETLFWPKRAKTSQLTHKPDKRELVVTCEELGLLALGETNAPRYQIAVTLQQQPRPGNVGLFFGYHKKEEGATRIVKYQILELFMVKADPKGPIVRVDWRSVQEDADGRHRNFTTSQNSAEFLFTLKEHRLTLTVGPKGLEEVTVDEQVLPRLRASAMVAPPPPPPADYKGKFGIYVYTGNVAVWDARYRFEEQP